MRQPPSNPTTRYETVKKPVEADGYAQRIPMWEAVDRLGSATRSELLHELQRTGYERPNRATLDEDYCRIELTDMTRRGLLRRLND